MRLGEADPLLVGTDVRVGGGHGVEAETELLLAPVPLQGGLHALALALQDGPQVVALAVSTARQSIRRKLGQVGRPRLQMRAELLDVVLRGLQETAPGNLRRRASGTGSERVLEQVQGAGLRLSSVGRERPATARRFNPARGNGHQFLVQALGGAPVQRQPPEQHDPGDRVCGREQAGARQIVVEPLGTKACQQPLHQAMLQVQVYGVFGQHAGVREHHRAHRSLLPPLGQLLVLLVGRTQRVDGSGPTRVGGHSPAHIGKAGKVHTGLPLRSTVSTSASAPLSCREQESASRNGTGSKRVQVREASSRSRHRSICARSSA